MLWKSLHGNGNDGGPSQVCLSGYVVVLFQGAMTDGDQFPRMLWVYDEFRKRELWMVNENLIQPH